MYQIYLLHFIYGMVQTIIGFREQICSADALIQEFSLVPKEYRQ